jgi:hypothetical protein
MKTPFVAGALAALALTMAVPSSATDSGGELSDFRADLHALKQFRDGRDVFRYATFGDEDFWGGTLGLDEAIAGKAHGGVGDGVSPKTALAVGLKVDVDALPRSVVRALKQNKVNLDDPAVTLDLLRAGAVVGVTGFFDKQGRFTSVGIQCALCHSTVDDSFAKGIGHRLDGWANRDLQVGTIISLVPRLQAVADTLGVPLDTVRKVLASWGPGKFDAELFLDGKGLRDDGQSAATLIPPAFGLAGVNLHTWTGWGNVTHWNAFVANLEMHGKGTFFDPRLDDAQRFPLAAKQGLGHVTSDEDQITPLLGVLQIYQLSLPVPTAPRGSFSRSAAERGEKVFNDKARCGSCHVPPLFTEPGWNLHTAEELGIDDFQAQRAPDQRYRTSPLRGLWTHTKGGFYHDGRFATLAAVIDHYDSTFHLGLSASEKADLEQYLRSL